MGLRRKGWTVDGLDPLRWSGADATRTNREWTRMGMEEGLIRAATMVVLTTVNWQPGGHREIPLRESQRDSAIQPGVAPPRRYPGYMPHISTTPEGVVPWHHRARLLADARNRESGQRHHGFSMSQPTLCVVIHTFVASAQPRCGCCAPPKRTRGSAENRATPGFGAEHLRRSQWGGRISA